MLCLTLVLALLAPQAVEGPPAAQPEPQTYNTGPLRVELVAMREVRMSATDPALAARLESDLRFQFRVVGEKISQISQFGELWLEDMVDDTGKQLVDESTYEGRDPDATRPLNVDATRLARTGLILGARALPSNRKATKLTKIRGHVRLVMADESNPITILNPLEYHGEVIRDPRLAALGVEMRMVPVSECENAPPANRSIAIQTVAKGEHVKSISFADGWMRPINARQAPIRKKSGEQCQLYYFDDPSVFTDELQMIIEIHPTVEDVRLPVELDDVDLP